MLNQSIKSCGIFLYHLKYFLFSVETYIALFLCAIANGIVYIAGLSYVNIRAEKQERPMRVALCHAWKMIGFAVVLTLYLFLLSDDGVPVEGTLTEFYQIIGYVFIGTSGIFISLVVVNEFRQRQGIIYNYKDCLDHDNAIANNYCKLFSRNEVIVERSSTVSAAGLWKSTENLLPRNKKNYTNLWTLYLMLPKLHGAVMFHYLLVSITLLNSRGYVDWQFSKGLVVWIMAGGAIIGCVVLRFMNGARVYVITSAFGIMFMGIAYAFFYLENDIMIIFLWLYFASVSVATAVPDISLMEIAKIRFSEGALAVGYFIEIVTIAVLQSTQRSAIILTEFGWYNEKYFLPIAVSTIVILVLTSLLYQLHMPNTFDKSLLQIQNELLKYKKYFVFTFEKDVSSSVPRRTSESSQYTTSNNNVNVFEDHAKNITDSTQIHYSEVSDRLPDPPVNKVKNFDYSTDIPKPPSIIPRVKIAKSQNNSLYGSQNKFWKVLCSKCCKK